MGIDNRLWKTPKAMTCKKTCNRSLLNCKSNFSFSICRLSNFSWKKCRKIFVTEKFTFYRYVTCVWPDPYSVHKKKFWEIFLTFHFWLSNAVLPIDLECKLVEDCNKFFCSEIVETKTHSHYYTYLPNTVLRITFAIFVFNGNMAHETQMIWSGLLRICTDDCFDHLETV